MHSINHHISETVVRRLTDYLHCLRQAESQAITLLTSKDISGKCGMKPSVIRKDLAVFGAYGVRGRGYRVCELKEQLCKILGLDKAKRVILIGAGNLGSAILNYPGFRNANFHFAAAFDNDQAKTDSKIHGTPVLPADEMNAYVKREKIEIAVLAVPAEEAPMIVEQLRSGKIKGILNFTSHIFPKHMNGIYIHNIDLAVELELTSYCMKHCSPPGNEGLR